MMLTLLKCSGVREPSIFANQLINPRKKYRVLKRKKAILLKLSTLASALTQMDPEVRTKNSKGFTFLQDSTLWKWFKTSGARILQDEESLLEKAR